ncbi:MAG: hypothetical protein IKN79_03420 [Eubacterium sp.]|nr:hypothetical protein [Eubacterium sp.]
MTQKVRNRIIAGAVLLAVVLFFVLRSVFAKDTVVPGNADIKYSTDYGRYLTELPGNGRPDAEIRINAKDFTAYTEEGNPATPEVKNGFEGYEGDSILTSETAVVTYTCNVEKEGL